MSVITIYGHGGRTELSFLPGKNLMELLRENGLAPDAPCGGHGLCGKCRVLLDTGSGPESVTVCGTVLHGDCSVLLPERTGDIQWNSVSEHYSVQSGRKGCGAAVDLGTTTVALSLYRLSDGACLGSVSRWNAQSVCGADVISRIGFCIDEPDGLTRLGGMIREQISDMLLSVCREHGIAHGELTGIFLSGNTAMQHIFVGADPSGIAAAPFTPETYFDDGEPYMLGDIPVYPSPCVSAYVGGDITAGLLGSGLFERPGRSLYIDVGTNGEMALGGKDGFLTCAVASGPAFEGAGISCGMPATKGAVCSVELHGDELYYEVIGGGEALGLCGSGLLDLAACLTELGYIGESGRLEENEDGEAVFYLTDRVYIDQRDVRRLQLAKAAVAAGLKLLLESEGLSLNDVGALYLAGGFGNRMRPESAVRIGMLPSELKERIRAVGNACLAGTERALLDPASGKTLLEIKRKCRYIELSSHERFNDCFVDEMSFPEVSI